MRLDRAKLAGEKKFSTKITRKICGFDKELSGLAQKMSLCRFIVEIYNLVNIGYSEFQKNTKTGEVIENRNIERC